MANNSSAAGSKTVRNPQRRFVELTVRVEVRGAVPDQDVADAVVRGLIATLGQRLWAIHDCRVVDR